MARGSIGQTHTNIAIHQVKLQQQMKLQRLGKPHKYQPQERTRDLLEDPLQKNIQGKKPKASCRLKNPVDQKY